MAGVRLLAPGLGQLGVAGALGLELLLELALQLRDPGHLGRPLVERRGSGMVAGDLGLVRGLGLGGALVGPALLVLQRAQLPLALAHLALEILELALDPAQLGRLLLGLRQRRAHPVEIELDRLQLAAQAVDQRLALAQQVVGRRVGVHGDDRTPVGAPAAAVGALVAERADLGEALRLRVLIEACRLPHQEMAVAKRAASGILDRARHSVLDAGQPFYPVGASGGCVVRRRRRGSPRRCR